MTRSALLEQHMRHIARHMTARARRGVFDANAVSPDGEAYVNTCVVDDALTQTRLCFTRERRDGELLWHLSIAALPRFLAGNGHPAVSLDPDQVRAWPPIFFASAMRLVKAQEPANERGQRLGVWRWFLFCDANWRPVRSRATLLEPRCAAVLEAT